jgi:hypothetical protein
MIFYFHVRSIMQLIQLSLRILMPEIDLTYFI